MASSPEELTYFGVLTRFKINKASPWGVSRCGQLKLEDPLNVGGSIMWVGSWTKQIGEA